MCVPLVTLPVHIDHGIVVTHLHLDFFTDFEAFRGHGRRNPHGAHGVFTVVSPGSTFDTTPLTFICAAAGDGRPSSAST
jgi:hypothetical protein